MPSHGTPSCECPCALSPSSSTFGFSFITASPSSAISLDTLVVNAYVVVSPPLVATTTSTRVPSLTRLVAMFPATPSIVIELPGANDVAITFK